MEAEHFTFVVDTECKLKHLSLLLQEDFLLDVNDETLSISTLKEQIKTKNNRKAIELLEYWIELHLQELRIKPKRQKTTNEAKENLEEAMKYYNKGIYLYWRDQDRDSVPFFEKAAQLSFPPAIARLYHIFIDLKDQQLAQKYKNMCIEHREWFVQAALTETADALSYYAIYCYLVDDVKQGILYTEKAADKGCPEAQNYLGYCLLYGNDGVKKDNQKAWKYFCMAAENGDNRAQYRLGQLYRTGIGEVKTDYKQSFYWFHKAANSGDPRAQYKLARMYGRNYSGRISVKLEKFIQGCLETEGTKFSFDLKKSFYWYHKAATQSHKHAVATLGEWYYYGTGVRQDYMEAVFWLQSAASKNQPKALLLLARCYEFGDGVPQNIEKAQELITQSHCKEALAEEERMLTVHAKRSSNKEEDMEPEEFL